MPQDLKDKVIWFLVGGLLMVLVQLSWHGVTTAYANRDDITVLKTELPAIKEYMRDGFERQNNVMKEVKTIIKEYLKEGR